MPAITLAALAWPAAADVAISEVGEVREGLITAGITVEIGQKCSALEVRRIEGAAFLWGLRNTARRAGFSQDEIAAYIDNAEEKKRLEAIARDRMRRMGVVEGREETYCALGRAEMAKDSTIGRHLRAR